jgi:hypothetical protein
MTTQICSSNIVEALTLNICEVKTFKKHLCKHQNVMKITAMEFFYSREVVPLKSPTHRLRNTFLFSSPSTPPPRGGGWSTLSLYVK